MKKNNFIFFGRLLCVVLTVCFVAIFLQSATFAEGEKDCGEGNHSFSVYITKEATEDEDGEKTYVCDVCGYTYTSVMEAYGHKWGEWITDREPTCSEEGLQHRVCTKHPEAPHTEYAAIPATGVHKYIPTQTEPTCTEDGFTTYVCEFCGDTYTEPGAPATGHLYTETVTEKPDCETPGLVTYTCDKCGDTYTVQVPACGHEFSEWVTDKEATATEEGLRYRVCLNNSEHVEREILPMLDAETDTGINGWDIAFMSLTPGVLLVFGGLIYSDVRLLSWYRKCKMGILGIK